MVKPLVTPSGRSVPTAFQGVQHVTSPMTPPLRSVPLVLSLIVAGWSAGAQAGEPGARDRTAGEGQPSGDQEDGENTIVVIGRRQEVLAGIPTEDSIDEASIAAYGLDTIGDLLEEIAAQVGGTREDPIILVNGQPTAGIDDIADLPAEAIERLELLGRGAASRLGKASSRRVINVTIKPNLVQTTGNAAAKFATAGGTDTLSAGLSVLHQVEGNRETGGLKGHRASVLDESERTMIPLIDSIPYPGEYRTLRSGQRAIGANAGIVRKLGTASKLGLTVRGDRSIERGRNGPAIASIAVPGAPARLTRVFGPLLDRSKSDMISGALTFNAPLGDWQFSLLATANLRWSERLSQIGVHADAFEALVRSGTVDPLSPPEDGSVLPLFGSGTSSSSNLSLQAIANGTIATLPAGKVGLNLTADWDRQRASSSSTGRATATDLSTARDIERAAASVSIPLIAGEEFPGEVTVDVLGALRHVSDVGLLVEYSAGIMWSPLAAVSLDFKLSDEARPPSATILAQAPVILPNVRVADFLRDATVEVDYLIGGNPDVVTPRSRTWSAAVTILPLRGTSFSAEYTRTRTRGAISSLPPASAEVQAAFPDRFVRDAGGRLVRVDARYVNFARESEDMLHWSIDLRRTIGGGDRAPSGSAGGDRPSSRSRGPLSAGAKAVRVNARIAHRWVLSSTRQARADLLVVDLLDGGAPGYGSGKSAHALDFAVGAGWHGMGLHLTGSWFSASTIRASDLAGRGDLHFGAKSILNLRAFANLAPHFPESSLFKGSRVTLNVVNLFDTRQRVIDEAGETPLAYQSALVDPVGRTVSLSFRKIF